MYLYNLNGGKVEVYSMYPNLKKTYRFKKDEMENIPKNMKVIKAISEEFGKHKDVNRVNYIDNSDIYIPSKDICTIDEVITHNIFSGEKCSALDLLNEYYTAITSDNDLYHVLGIPNKNKIKFLKYFMLCSPKYSRVENKRFINFIIPLTKSMYLLELLIKYCNSEKKEILYELEIEDIRELIKLFDFERCRELDFNLNITQNEEPILFNLESIINEKLKNSEKILKYIK